MAILELADNSDVTGLRNDRTEFGRDGAEPPCAGGGIDDGLLLVPFPLPLLATVGH